MIRGMEMNYADFMKEYKYYKKRLTGIFILWAIILSSIFFVIMYYLLNILSHGPETQMAFLYLFVMFVFWGYIKYFANVIVLKKVREEHRIFDSLQSVYNHWLPIAKQEIFFIAMRFLFFFAMVLISLIEVVELNFYESMLSIYLGFLMYNIIFSRYGFSSFEIHDKKNHGFFARMMNKENWYQLSSYILRSNSIYFMFLFIYIGLAIGAETLGINAETMAWISVFFVIFTYGNVFDIVLSKAIYYEALYKTK